MANYISPNPMVLADTGLITNNPLIIKAISFQGTTDVDDMVLKDKTNTNTIWSTKLGDVSVDGYEKNISFGSGIPVKGLHLNTIDHGVVLIYT